MLVKYLLQALLLSCAALTSRASPGLTGDIITDGSDGFPDPCVFQDPASGLNYVYADRCNVAVSQGKDIRGPYTVKQNGYVILNQNGSIFANLTNGSDQSAGAPSVGYLDGKYVVYVSTQTKIFAAAGSSPLGPFTRTSDDALLVPASPTPTPIAFPAAPALFQYNGVPYLLYKYGRAADYNRISSICIQQLTPDGLSKASEPPAQLFTVNASMPNNGTANSEDEGPNMVFHNNMFYLFFNLGTYCSPDYEIAYATSSTLMPGKLYTPRGVFLNTNSYPQQGVTLNAPGGISFVNDTTFIFMSYEPNTTLFCQGTPKPPRNVHAGQLVYNADGTVSVAPSWGA